MDYVNQNKLTKEEWTALEAKCVIINIRRIRERKYCSQLDPDIA